MSEDPDPGSDQDESPDPGAESVTSEGADPPREPGDAAGAGATTAAEAVPETGGTTETETGGTTDPETGRTTESERPAGHRGGDPGSATPPSGERSWIGNRVRAMFDFEHQHTPGTKLLVLAAAVVLGLYASWLLADLGGRTLSFLVFTAAGTYTLYARPTRRDVLIRGLYSLAVLLVLTPVVLNVTFLLADYGTGGIGNPLQFVFSSADLVYLLAFSLFAAVPAGIAFLLDRRR